MNTLSWLLYLAGVVSGLSTFFLILSTVALFTLFVYTFVAVVENSTGNCPMAFPKIRHFVAVILFTCVSLMVPSERVIYLIAASELGEAAATSEVGQEILEDMRAVIRNQLEQLGSGE